MPDASFKDYVLEQLANVRGVSARAMFGGYGLYKNALMFGLILDGELYFKVDDVSQPLFEARKSRPFVYDMKGKQMSMSYWYMAEDLIEDADEFCAWAARAYDAAVRNAKTKSKKKTAGKGNKKTRTRR